jgi:riboflavin synthase
MFTGIIEALGSIAAIETQGGDKRMTFAATGYLRGVGLGDSIAINGVCLTATSMTDDAFSADLSVETLTATTAGHWKVGDPVNLEKALTMGKPLGGHWVSGHVDGLATLVSRVEEARSWRLQFEAPEALAHYIARKGSVTLDGISLTVNEVEGRRFGVNIIPQTWTHTTLGQRSLGDPVNLEVDLMARYLERLMTARTSA